MAKQEIQLVKSELSHGNVLDVRSALPRIAEELGVPENSLHVYEGAHRVMYTNMRDSAYKLDGLLGGLPFFRTNPMHAKDVPGVGVAYYKNRADPSLRYAIHAQPGSWRTKVVTIIPSGSVFRLRRNWHRALQQIARSNSPPLLADGLLAAVVDATIGFLRNAKQIEQYGVKIKRGILLDGPPGNGKTMLCRYIQRLCDQHKFTWGTVSAADIDKAYSEKKLDALFCTWQVTFFDDIDISYLNRREGAGRVACSILSAMDGMHQNGHLVRVFTTNEEVTALDEAFLRPGRIDNIITLGKPGGALRRKIIESWPNEITKAIDVSRLVNRTEGFSCAEVEAIRTYLVTWRVINGGGWDLDRALQEFAIRRGEAKKSCVGFTAEMSQNKLELKPEPCV